MSDLIPTRVVWQGFSTQWVSDGGWIVRSTDDCNWNSPHREQLSGQRHSSKTGGVKGETLSPSSGFSMQFTAPLRRGTRGRQPGGKEGRETVWKKRQGEICIYICG